MGGVDALTGTYHLPCPTGGSARVRLSSFREIERLPGPSHPALYRVVFACACGGEHVALVGHDALDWAPLGLDEGITYVNLMTSRRDDLGASSPGSRRRGSEEGEWPWCFFCHRRVHAARDALVVPIARTASRDRRRRRRPVPGVRLDLHQSGDSAARRRPFHCDSTVGVVARVFEDGALSTIDAFRAELGAVSFDEKRLVL
jgi:hypothetical protein